MTRPIGNTKTQNVCGLLCVVEEVKWLLVTSSTLALDGAKWVIKPCRLRLILLSEQALD